MTMPYNTGKVLIGSAYVPRPARMSRDAERVQAVLLAKPVDPIDELGHRVAFWVSVIGLVVIPVLIYRGVL